MSRLLLVVLIAAGFACATSQAKPGAAGPQTSEEALPEGLRLGAEWYDLVLNGKKVGFLSTDVARGTEQDLPVVVVSEWFVLSVRLGAQKVSSEQRTTRYYEARTRGKLLRFTRVTTSSNETRSIEGDVRPDGIVLTRKGPSGRAELMTFAPTRTTLDDYFAFHLAAIRKSAVSATELDLDVVTDHAITATYEAQVTRTIAGAPRQLAQVRVRAPRLESVAWISDDGRILEMSAQGLTMVATDEGTARALEETASEVPAPAAE